MCTIRTRYYARELAAQESGMARMMKARRTPSESLECSET